MTDLALNRTVEEVEPMEKTYSIQAVDINLDNFFPSEVLYYICISQLKTTPSWDTCLDISIKQERFFRIHKHNCEILLS